jgi:hypothetical protein
MTTPPPARTLSGQPNRGSSPSLLRIDFLGVLFIVWGALTTIVGLSTLALGVGAAALLASSPRPASFAASFTAGAFTTLALIAIIWGAAHVGVGVALRRHRRWSRLGALMLGSIDLVLLPYGTALGVYGLWVLLREDARTLFDPGNLPATARPAG